MGMSEESVTYVKPGRKPRLVTSPSERVKAEFEGFKPAESEPEEAPVEGSGDAPETNDDGAHFTDPDATDPFGA